MFLLLLMGLGAAGVKAQVRIGGNTPPNPAAALDLNANDDATPAGNKGALALPRVSLASTTAQLNGATPVTGMLVYNTNVSMIGGNGSGIVFWDGGKWQQLAKTANTGSPLSLSLVLDTFYYANAAAGSLQLAWNESPTTKWTDICVNSYGWMLAKDGWLYILALWTGNPIMQHVVCYRPQQ